PLDTSLRDGGPITRATAPRVLGTSCGHHARRVTICPHPRAAAARARRVSAAAADERGGEGLERVACRTGRQLGEDLHGFLGGAGGEAAGLLERGILAQEVDELVEGRAAAEIPVEAFDDVEAVAVGVVQRAAAHEQ